MVVHNGWVLVRIAQDGTVPGDERDASADLPAQLFGQGVEILGRAMLCRGGHKASLVFQVCLEAGKLLLPEEVDNKESEAEEHHDYQGHVDSGDTPLDAGEH